MSKTSRKQVFKCQEHKLTLQPLKNNLYFTQIISCCFCNEKKSTNKSRNGKKEQDNGLTCPIFNADYNHGSPAFILSSEKNYFSQNGFRLKVEHDKKIQHYTDQKSQMCIPKPRSKHNYCSVCRKNYDDYLQHILSSKHKKEISQSKFNKYILQVAKKFEASLPNEQNISSDHTVQDDDVQIIEGPRKRIKKNPQQQSQKSLSIHQISFNNSRVPFYHGPPISNFPSMAMANLTFDLNLMYQRQMLNMGTPPYYYFPHPMYMPTPGPPLSYSYIARPISSNGPLRANYVYINQNV